MTPRTPNQKKQYANLSIRLAKYGKLVEQLYEKYNREAAKIAMRTNYDPDEGKMFHFQDFPQTRDAVQKLLAEYMDDMTGTINRTTAQEWENSNEFQDLVANKVLKAYGVQRKDGTEYERYYQTNSDQLKAFQTRTVNGMNLSRRVWNLKEQYKQELEMGLSVGIERGTSAATLAKQMKQFLNEPDKLFRRVRDKFGNLQLSKNARAYHPGRGIYRSSYKNAMRLTRSETNMAYRTAEQTRWRQFDFVVGYEIKLSQSHPCEDVCNTLAGKYPKDFVWTGWHPQDMCYCVSILKTQDEFWRDLGEDEPGESENQVDDVPEAFKDWVRDNEERIESARNRGTTPYFIEDNKKYVDKVLMAADGDSEGESGKNSQDDKYRGNLINRITNTIEEKIISKEFKDISNIEELTNKAEILLSGVLGNNVNVSINEDIMPLSIAKAHLTELYSIAKSYSFRQGNLTRIILGYDPDNPNEHGITTTSKNGNLKTIKLTSVIDNRNDKNADRNSRCDKSRLPFSLASHECAHALFSFNAPYNLKTAGFRQEIINAYNSYRNEISKHFLSDNLKMVDKISIGDYGSTGEIGEFMAECFQEYRNSSNPSKYAKIVGKIMDKYFKK